MKRRDFIKRMSYSGAGAMVLGNIPVNLMASSRAHQLAAAAADNDKVLIFVQLHGGNDTLNTLVPVSQYTEYRDLRPNLVLPDTGTRSYRNVDTTVEESKQVGLHPDMHHMHDMYNDGKLAIVQNVGYPDMNLSHFRGRDIVFMGGDAYDDYESGWMGRFLDYTYPGYPDVYPTEAMPDPLGLEFGGTLSLAFHRENGIPAGLHLTSPEAFYELINRVGVTPPIVTPNSHAGDELKYIMDFENKSEQYAPRLKQVYDNGSNSSVVYPDAYPFYTPSYVNNPLTGQLRLVARLLAGGIKTRVFLIRMGGFDTHGDQVYKDDFTVGHHAALLYHLSSGMKAFYDDLHELGLEDRVLSMTFTEFGRRAKSNASYGTDHGTATAVFLYGTGLNPGIYGQNPDLTDLQGYNLKYEVDYRRIYTSVVQDWLGADPDTMEAVGFDPEMVTNKLPIINTGTVDNSDYMASHPDMKLYPNVAKEQISLEFFLNKHSKYTIYIYSVDGRKLIEQSAQGIFGSNKMTIDLQDLKPGKYVVQLKTVEKVNSGSFIKK